LTNGYCEKNNKKKRDLVAIVKVDMRKKWSKASLAVAVKKTNNFAPHFMVMMSI
jgi:hypothetical protein